MYCYRTGVEEFIMENPGGRVSDVQGSSHSWVTPSLGLMAGHRLPLEIFGKLGDFKCWNRVRKGIFVDCYDHPLWTRLAPNNPPIHHALDPILAGRNDFVKYGLCVEDKELKLAVWSRFNQRVYIIIGIKTPSLPVPRQRKETNPDESLIDWERTELAVSQY
ncbi:hypothetical protein RRG08_008664 [Elysia crispata]|uniref:Uncharacterized protein n=1 Tax=Elysia crispata TaxID=231223 RepID=A0AAE0XXD8_9GAST|nr:hypothetical protein RRG08_008664 [Elysia crispata]